MNRAGKADKRSMKVLVGLLSGQAMGIHVPSAVLPDTRALLERKGYLVKGADVENTDYMIIVGPLAHCIPQGLPPRLGLEMHERTGHIMFVEMTSDELHRGLELHDDAPQPEYIEEMQATVASVQKLADTVKGAVERAAALLKEDAEHSAEIHLGAVLPDGEKLEAIFCRSCALDFVEGRTDGKQYKTTKFLRLLMAFVIGTHDEARAEKEINEKAIKASLDKTANTTKLH